MKALQKLHALRDEIVMGVAAVGLVIAFGLDAIRLLSGG
jgi:hypothetical protein